MTQPPIIQAQAAPLAEQSPAVLLYFVQTEQRLPQLIDTMLHAPGPITLAACTPSADSRRYVLGVPIDGKNEWIEQ
jgi:hypothetical protein